MRIRQLLLVASLGVTASAASAVSIDWVSLGGAGNAADDTGFGAVAYTYKISKYEVTNAQYAEFLNAVAASDTNDLYDTEMSSDIVAGGITRSGVSGSFTYSAKPGLANKPVTYITFYDALRFANWLHNGQPSGAQDNTTTEDGAYTITAQGIADNTITRNAGAKIFLPSEDEWYKAAYYDALSATYFDYPTGTDTQTGCVLPASDTGNSANCNFVGWDEVTQIYPKDIGAYGLSDSPAGTFDQGGNVSEWNEAISGADRGLRGGSWASDPASLAVGDGSLPTSIDPAWGDPEIGFRVAVPEPGTGLLVATGLLGVAGWRRRSLSS